MKKIIVLGLLIISQNILLGQIKQVEKKNCYDKSAALKGKRFVEWECGKSSGVIDCNEKLEVDEGSNTIFSKGSGEPFTGTCETCHMNGIKERQVRFVNGKEDGLDTTHYMSGCVMVTRNHIQGVENGQWNYYYDSTSNLAWEMNYFAGQKHGKHIFFTKKGDTTLWENYKYGLLDGKKIKYYSKSRIQTEINYQKGLMHGAFINYNREGVIIEKINYKEGKRNGESVYFYDDGKLLRTESWSMDVKNGEFKTFYYQQFIQTLESYVKGKREGAFEEYYPDQKPKRIASYRKDVLVEEHEFDVHGNETKTFGAKAGAKTEDDQVPGGKKKKKKKK